MLREFGRSGRGVVFADGTPNDQDACVRSAQRADSTGGRSESQEQDGKKKKDETRGKRRAVGTERLDGAGPGWDDIRMRGWSLS